MSASTGEVRELAAAICDALAVPSADSRDPGAALAEERLMAKRAALLRGVLGNFLAKGDADIAVTARTIREATADTPATYAVYENRKVLP